MKTIDKETTLASIGRILDLAEEAGLESSEPQAIVLVFPGGEYALAGAPGRNRTEVSKALVTIAAEELMGGDTEE